MNSLPLDNQIPEKKTVIVDAQSVANGSFGSFSADVPWTMWYFGARYETFLAVQNEMPKSWVSADNGAALEKAAERFTNDVANIENTQFCEGADRTWWDASDLGDRGPYVTNLLEGCAQLQVIEQAIHAGEYNVFVIENTDYAFILFRYLRKVYGNIAWGHPNGRLSSVNLSQQIINPIKRFYLSIRAILSGLKYAMRQRRANIKARSLIPLDLQSLQKCDVLLCIWGGKDVFPEKGPLEHDRYFGRLPALLQEQGHTVGYIVCSVVGSDTPQQIADNVVKAEDPIICVEDCLSLRKIFSGAIQAFFSSWRIILNVNIGNIDIEPVLRFERRREMQTWRPMQSRFFQYVGETLAQNGIQPRSIFHLYENQPWEKMLRKGLRQALPETKIVGYQHVPLAPLFINTYPSSREIEQGLTPDHILVPGERFMETLLQWGMAKEKISVAGGLRFEKPSVDEHVVRGVVQELKQTPTILCCTSIDFDESLELVHKILMAQLRVKTFHIIVNFHPAFPQSLRDRLTALIDVLLNGKKVDIEYSNASVSELLSQVDLVAYNTSSSAYDALAIKCPVICILPETTLDYDRVPRGLSFRGRSADDIANLLNDFVQGDLQLPNFEDLNKAISKVNVSAFEAVIPKASNGQ